MPHDAGEIKGRLTVDKSQWDRSAKEIKASQQKMSVQSKKTGAAFKGMWKQVAVGIGVTNLITSGIRGLIRQMSDTVKKGREFEREWANVTTMLSVSQTETEKMKHELRMLSPTLGDTTELAKGMYQVLSASIEPAKAIEFLGVAAKSARAGVTETATAVDAITTVINAYGMAAEDATEVSDIMFQTVKRGKTTYEELAHSLGTVVPISATVGVNFKEIAAAVATMTRMGIKSSKATMQLRQVLMSILTPSAEAEQLSETLGISFGANALKTKGLAGWLKELREKTKGNVDQMKVFIPNARALTAVMALAGIRAEEYAGDLEDMEVVLGNTDEAFRKQMDSVDFWAETFKVSMDKIKIAIYEGLTSQLRESIKTSEDFDEKVTKATNEAANDVSLHVGAIVEEFTWLGKAIKDVDQFLLGWSYNIGFGVNAADDLAEAEVKLAEALERGGRKAAESKEEIVPLSEETKTLAERAHDVVKRWRELAAFTIDWEGMKPPSELIARWEEFYNLVETPELDLIWEQQMQNMEQDTLNFMSSIIPGMSFMTDKITEDIGTTNEKTKLSFEEAFSAVANAAGNLFSQLGALSQVRFDNELALLEKETLAKRDALTDEYEAERETIENSMMSEEEKTAALLALEQKKRAAIEKLEIETEEKKKAIQEAAFKSQKKISLVTAAINIAEAITKALTGAIPPWNAILAGITAAAGAVQLAAISAQKFPSAEKGAYLPAPTLIEAGHGRAGEVILPLDRAPLNEIIQGAGGGTRVDLNFYAPIISTTGLADRELDEAAEYLLAKVQEQFERSGDKFNA